MDKETIRNTADEEVIRDTTKIPYFSQGEGKAFKVIADALNATVGKGFIDPGQSLPAHRHPNEQIGYVLAGHCDLILNGERYHLEAGCRYYIPPNQWHIWENNGIERFLYIDIFTPRRDDLRSGKYEPETME